MSIVKITKKEKLDELLAKITLRLGRKPTQQEVLDLCVELGEEHFDELIMKLSPLPILDDEKIKRIISKREALKNIEWNPISKSSLSKDDYDIYSH